MIFIFLFCLFMVASGFDIFNYRHGGRYNKKVQVAFVFLTAALCALAAFRYNYGNDFVNYLIHFNEVNTVGDAINSTMEEGYSFLAHLINILGLGFSSLLLAVAVLSMSVKGFSIYKISPLPIVSLFVFYLLFFIPADMEQMRHGVAMAFVLLAVYFFLTSRKRLGLGMIAAASLFHYSALFMLPLYFWDRVKLDSARRIALLIVAMIPISFLLTPDVLGYFNDTFIHSRYLTTKLALYQGESFSPFSVTVLLRLGVLFLFFRYVYEKDNPLDRMLLFGYLMSILVFIATSSLGVVAARASAYYRILEIFIVAQYIVYVVGLARHAQGKMVQMVRAHIAILSLLFLYYFVKFAETLSSPEYYNYQVGIV